MQGRVFVGSEDAGAVRATQGMQGIQAVEPTSSRLRLVDFIKIIRENGVDEATASDEDFELAFSKRASMGTGGQIKKSLSLCSIHTHTHTHVPYICVFLIYRCSLYICVSYI